MKFVHLGDLHLGKALGDFDLKDDQAYILGQILEIVDAEGADAVLLAGDIYDKSVPSEAAVNMLDDFLSRLAKKGVAVFMISGNHDSDDRLNYGSRLFKDNRIYISAVYDGTLRRYIMKDEFGEVSVYLLPFVKASQVKHFFPDKEISDYEDAVRLIVDKADIDRSGRNVLVAHQFVTGRSGRAEDGDPALAGSESIGVRSVGLVEKIGYDCFDAFDYVALGHIHSPQRVGRDEVRYAGSPLKYSISEVNNRKSVPVVTLGQKGDVKIELVPLKPLRELRHIKGKLKELVDRNNVGSPGDFIYATLTDEDIINDAMGMLQRVYPNTVKIDFDNSRTRELEQVDISKIAENKSFPELVSEFYELMYGCRISDEEMDMMRAAAREAGVMHEAG